MQYEITIIACIIRKGGSWPKLWDSALHLGSRHTIGLQNLSRLLVHHGRGLHPCPLCDEQGLSILIIDHVISAHKREIGLNIDLVDRLLLLLVDGDIQFVDNKGNTLFAQDRTGLKIVIKKDNACTDWHLISLRMRK